MTRLLPIACLAFVGLAPRASAQQLFEETKIVAPDAAPGDMFGSAVAADGDWLVVGAVLDDDLGEDSGSAYTFIRSGTEWVMQQKLTASDGAAGEQFGNSVAIDNTTLAVSAWREAHGGVTELGAVYVFVRSGTTWSQQAKLVADDASNGDHFGESVSVNGNTIIVGAPGDDNFGPQSGSMYVFSRTGTSWSQTQHIFSSGASAGERFGRSVGIDGPLLVVGAPSERDGRLYAFARTGSVWVEEATLLPGYEGGTSGAFIDAHLGTAVAISGNHVVGGAPELTGRGWAFAYSRKPSGVWTDPTDLNPLGTTCCQRFGRAVSIDGDRLVIGAPFQPIGLSGTAYIYGRVGTVWTILARLNRTDAAFDDRFGNAVAITGDRVFVGAWEDDDAGPESGSVYKYVAPPFQLGNGFCFGDGSGTPCPCGNESEVGAGEGCRASATTQGARLVTWGSTSVAADDLAFGAVGTPLGQSALLFAGTLAVNGGAGLPFGDGLRCVGGEVIRINITTANAFGLTFWGPGLSADGAFLPGETRLFQVWNRTNGVSVCGSNFNFSNGLEVTFTP